MDNDNEVLGQLGGFALGEVFKDLGIDTGDGINTVRGQLGLGKSSNAFSRDTIYGGKFVDAADDDDDDGSDQDKDDLEAEVDREMYDEKWQTKASSRAQPARGGGQQQTLMRGEEDDFDDDDDNEDAGGAGQARVGQHASQPGDTATVIKQEPGDDNMFGDVPFDQNSMANANLDRMSIDPVPPPQPRRPVDVKELFPSFDYGKTLDFTELFSTTYRPRKRQKTAAEGSKVPIPFAREIPRSRSTRDALVAPLKPSTRSSALRDLLIQAQEREREEWEDEGSSDEELLKAIERSTRQTQAKWHVPESSHLFDMAELDDWEDDVIWGAPNGTTPQVHLNLLAPRNAEFEQGDWLKSIIWDADRSYKDFTKLNLNLNDTSMLLEVQAPASKAAKDLSPAGIVVERAAGLDPFNLSNDAEYEVTREFKKKAIRQTFGLLEVQHAYPAQKLQLPFYKTRLTKADLRSFHRPPLQFPANIPITFTKSRSAKKKKDKQGRKIKKGDGEQLRHMSDITLKDTGPFILWEYSEENPPIISNVGMGSILVNYYRKRSPEDPFVPQLDLGEPFLLEGTDESPFKAFGHVNPGQTVPTLYNNLIRAPLFRHKPPQCEFLVCRVTIEGEAKYYIREIKNLFVVGQTYPLNEVPGPHSRKVTTLVKNRLQTIAFKLVQNSPRNRIKVQRLTRYFPDQNDLQMRQRLKEFMEYNRKGPDQGWWQIKKTIHVPDEQEMLKMATPEMVCLAESMQVGVRHLQDAGYGKAEEGGNGDDDSKLDIEQQLAPWITSKNFINATANKAMLKLHGDGDPTGRGEAFSFLRVSMKDIFLRAGEAMEDRLAEMANRPKSAHRYNVQEQQEVYKEEIARIWKAQWDSLSNPVEPVLTQADEERARGGNKERNRQNRGNSMAVDTPGAGTPRGRAGSVGSRASTPDRDDGMSVTSGKTGEYQGGQKNRTLRVRRLIAGRWETEIIREPSIIAAYVRQRQLIEEEKTEADDLLPSDDEGKNERARKRLKEQLEKLKRNQERRLARKNEKLGIKAGAMGVGGKRAVKTETTRICGNCGQRGHMKTSKKLCPRWHEFNAPKSAEPSGALPTGFGGGLALPSMGAAPAPVALAPKPVNKQKAKEKLVAAEKLAAEAAAAAAAGGQDLSGRAESTPAAMSPAEPDTPMGGAGSPPAPYFGF